MKRFIAFSFCLILPLTAARGANAAIRPDTHIAADLQAVFTAPPKVEGYPYQELLSAAAARYGLPLPYVLAVARGESYFEPKAKSSKGALGIMQVMPNTAAGYGLKPEELFDPAKNIDVGVHYLGDLYAQLQDPYLALAAYYCGSGGVNLEGYTLRQDCNEYVRYIHSHLTRIIGNGDKPKADKKGVAGHRHVLARFDNFLDGERFLAFLSRRMPDLNLDLYRTEVAQSDHLRYQYQVLILCSNAKEVPPICSAVESATGFALCR
jgi:hypothetical protein